MTKKPKSNDYAKLLIDIKKRVRAAQYDALRAVNKELIGLYWDIGKMITKRQKAAGWGKSVVEKLARDLQAEFPGIRGFSARNLWLMQDLYKNYCGKAKLQPMVAEIGWTHNVVIMQSCKDPLQREFYIRMTRKFGWTKNVLIHQIENQTYEKTMLNQTSFPKTLPQNIRNQAKLAVKDEYTFDFLEMADEHEERVLEQALIGRVEAFLCEMGGAFAFVGSQFRLEVGNSTFHIDLLLYHRRLQCLVAIELKAGKFRPEYIGKMQFYLAALDDLVRTDEENPSIGIVLCKSKDRTVVEYALKDTGAAVGVATYRVTSKLPAELKGELPAPEQIALLMGDEE